MRVTTYAEYDHEGNLLHWEGYEYSGEVAECKRGEAKSQAEKQQQTMMDYMKQAFGMQKGMVNPLVSGLQKMFQNPTGFSPEMLASGRSSIIQNTGQMGNDALSRAKSILASRGLGGGNTPYSGMSGKILGPTLMQPALERSSELNQFNIQDALAALQNKWQSASTLGNYANIFNPSTFAGGASSALQSRTQLETAPTMFNNIMSSLAEGAGKGLSSWVTKPA